MRHLILLVSSFAVTGCGLNQAHELSQHDTNEAVGSLSDKEQILDAILRDVLTNPELKDSLDFYGTAGDKQLALVSDSGYGVPWPADHKPKISSFHFSRSDETRESDETQPRMLGVRIDKYYNEDSEHSELFWTPIAVSIFNAGGTQNGQVIGGCGVYYTPRRTREGKWIVECEGLRDP